MASGELPREWERPRIRDRYRFTSKPRDLRLSKYPQVAFLPMDAIPTGRLFVREYLEKAPGQISSGTYFEEGDLLLSKITPCFENGKQAVAKATPNGFGIATTEVIPLKAVAGVSDISFLAYYLLDQEVRAGLASKMEGATGRQRLSKSVLEEWEMPFPPLLEQEAIAGVLSKLQGAVEAQDKIIATLKELKAATLAKLFREGLRGEPLKETEIGEIPESWEVVQLGGCCEVLTSSMAYSDLERLPAPDSDEAVIVHGLKVSDMNGIGNEREIRRCKVERRLPRSLAERKCVPANCVAFPKRGAAIATNKKRLLTTWTVLDPNVIAVRPKASLHLGFLYNWLLQFDLQSITEPGATPQLNKKNLLPVWLPLPPTIEEQESIAGMMKAMDKAEEQAMSSRASNASLFSSMLHLLMTGEVRISEPHLM